jgi:hypothetical protein
MTQQSDIELMEENATQSENELNSRQNHQLKSTLLASSEGYILFIGIALALIYTFWLGIKLLLSPDESQVLIGMTATELMFGRAAAMAFGYSMGLGHKTVIPICMIIETILVLNFYPLFVFSWRHLLVVKWLKNILERIKKSAETHKDKIQKYGVLGLFALLGLRIRLNLPIVLAGTYMAIVGWAYLLRHFHKQIASYSSYAAMVLMALLVFVIIIVHLLYRTFHENKNKT